jgi:hypothetical protein
MNHLYISFGGEFAEGKGTVKERGEGEWVADVRFLSNRKWMQAMKQ